MEIAGARDAKARAQRLLDEVGLTGRAHHYPSQLSGGEQQRVAIARAIVGRPSAILADEPTGALDSESGQTIMTLLADIARDPSHAHAVLVVTHDLRTRAFADRIVHIEDGQIRSEESGETARVKRFPAGFVAPSAPDAPKISLASR